MAAEARLVLRYGDEGSARAITGAVSPDNSRLPEGLSITTVQEGSTVTIQILCSKGPDTLLATLDDLLVCVLAAERSIQGLRMI